MLRFISLVFYPLWFIVRCSGVNAEASKVLVDAELLGRLVKSLEHKNEQLDSLLIRVDRLELREKQLQKQNEQLLARINTLESLETSMDDVNEDVKEDDLEDPGNKLHRIVQSFTGGPTIRKRQVTGAENGTSHIAFFAGISKYQHQGNDQLVVFDKIITNIGNAYNPQTGTFLAPVTGTYTFTADLMADNTHTTFCDFVKNGNILSTLYLRGSESPYATTSQTVIVELNQGEDVAIKNRNVHESLYGAMHSVFSGFLLRETYPSVVVG